MTDLQERTARAAELIRERPPVAVFTGAGVSTAAEGYNGTLNEHSLKEDTKGPTR